MDGIILLDNQITPEKDMINEMAQMGRIETPLYSIIQKATPSSRGKAIDGHQWWYESRPEGSDANAHIEGGNTGNSVSRTIGESKNHYQIVKSAYGISGSMEGKIDIENKDELARLGTIALEDHTKSLEKILMSNQAPLQRVNTTGSEVAGKMGGIGHWMTAENTNTSSGNLSRQLLRELFKFGYKNGVPCTHIFLSDTQKDRLDDLDLEYMRGVIGGDKLKVNDYMTLENFAYAPNVKVVLSPYVAEDEIIAINADSLALVHQRLTKPYEKGRMSDAIEKEIITEATLRVNNPFAVAKLSGLTI